MNKFTEQPPASINNPMDFETHIPVQYSNGAQHFYGVDGEGKKRHISADAMLIDKGYNPQGQSENNVEDYAQQRLNHGAIGVGELTVAQANEETKNHNYDPYATAPAKKESYLDRRQEKQAKAEQVAYNQLVWSNGGTIGVKRRGLEQQLRTQAAKIASENITAQPKINTKPIEPTPQTKTRASDSERVSLVPEHLQERARSAASKRKPVESKEGSEQMSHLDMLYAFESQFEQLASEIEGREISDEQRISIERKISQGFAPLLDYFAGKNFARGTENDLVTPLIEATKTNLFSKPADEDTEEKPSLYDVALANLQQTDKDLKNEILLQNTVYQNGFIDFDQEGAERSLLLKGRKFEAAYLLASLMQRKQAPEDLEKVKSESLKDIELKMSELKFTKPKHVPKTITQDQIDQLAPDIKVKKSQLLFMLSLAGADPSFLTNGRKEKLAKLANIKTDGGTLGSSLGETETIQLRNILLSKPNPVIKLTSPPPPKPSDAILQQKAPNVPKAPKAAEKRPIRTRDKVAGLVAGSLLLLAAGTAAYNEFGSDDDKNTRTTIVDSPDGDSIDADTSLTTITIPTTVKPGEGSTSAPRTTETDEVVPETPGIDQDDEFDEQEPGQNPEPEESEQEPEQEPEPSPEQEPELVKGKYPVNVTENTMDNFANIDISQSESMTILREAANRLEETSDYQVDFIDNPGDGDRNIWIRITAPDGTMYSETDDVMRLLDIDFDSLSKRLQ